MRDPGNEVEESRVSQTNRVFLKARFTTAPRSLFFLVMSGSRPKLPLTANCLHRMMSSSANYMPFLSSFRHIPPQEGFVKLAN